MPDLAMCHNKECPRRADCYRYRAIADDIWQTYFSPNHETCTDFMAIGGRRVMPVEEVEI